MRRIVRLDVIDIELVERVQLNARQTNRELAKAVGRTTSSVWERVKRLEREGLILGYRAVIAPAMLGADIDIVVRLELRSSAPNGLWCFESELKSAPGVLGATRTGPGAYLLRAASPATVAWIEAAILRCGLTAVAFESVLAMEEIVPYRDPPIRALINGRATSESEGS
ncbi:MAG: Lrp/AsnC family transcriptional regulator [Terricaulis sp.]|jgi:DNA-binding Lrp family transcriptional regulator